MLDEINSMNAHPASYNFHLCGYYKVGNQTRAVMVEYDALRNAKVHRSNSTEYSSECKGIATELPS